MSALDRLGGTTAVKNLNTQDQSRPNRHRRQIAIIGLITLVSTYACSDSPTETRTPLKSEAPYLCQVLPGSALETIFPTDESYEEDVLSGDFNSDLFSCTAQAGTEAGFHYGHRKSKNAENNYRTRMRDEPPDPQVEERLPSRLGEGWYTPRWPGDPTKAQPNSQSWVFWQCNNSSTLTFLTLQFGTPVEGRKPSNDIIRLMEIVQERYSELNGDCEVRPPESVPTGPTSTSSAEEDSS